MEDIQYDNKKMSNVVSKKNKIFVFSLILLLLGIVSFALSYTSKKQLKYVHTKDYIYCDSVQNTMDKKQDNKQELRINLRDVKNYSEFLTLKFNKKENYGSVYDVYLYGDSNYSTLNRLEYAFTYSKSGYLVVDLKDIKDVAAIGIPCPILDSVQQVEFHKNPHTFEKKSIPFKTTRFILLLLLSALIDIVIVAKLSVVKFNRDYEVKDILRKAIHVIIWIFLFAIIAFIIEKVLSTIMICLGFNTAFRLKRYIFFLLSMLIFGWIYLYRGKYSESVHKVFAGVAILTGLMFMLISPVYHNGWDIDIHYRLSVAAASLGDTYQTRSDLYITNARGVSFVQKTFQENQDIVNFFNEQNDDICEVSKQNISLAHLPAGIGVAIGRMINLSFYKTFLLGELFNLILYSLLTYLAIKKLKSGKYILATIALIPTNVFMASCYNYDYWVLGFSFLGIAYFVSMCQSEEKVSYKDEIICCLSLLLSCIPKQNYMLIMLLPFIIPVKKIKKKISYYAIACMPFVITGVSFALRAVGEMSSPGGDIRGGAGINPMNQLYYCIHHFASTIIMFIQFFFNAVSFGYFEEAFVSFGNLGFYKLGGSFIVISLIVAILFDRDSTDKMFSYTRFRVFALMYYVIEVCMIAAAFYLVFTPVGGDAIAGVQPRYFTPMLLPLALCIGPSKRVLDNKNKLAVTTFVIPTIISLLNISVLMLMRNI